MEIVGEGVTTCTPSLIRDRDTFGGGLPGSWFSGGGNYGGLYGSMPGGGGGGKSPSHSPQIPNNESNSFGIDRCKLHSAGDIMNEFGGYLELAGAGTVVVGGLSLLIPPLGETLAGAIIPAGKLIYDVGAAASAIGAGAMIASGDIRGGTVALVSSALPARIGRTEFQNSLYELESTLISNTVFPDLKSSPCGR